MNRRTAHSVLLAVLWPSGHALADPPPGYYATVDATNSTTLRTTLHEIIDDHERFPYTSTNTDTWDILELADEDPNNADHILDVYKNASYHKVGGETATYRIMIYVAMTMEYEWSFHRLSHWANSYKNRCTVYTHNAA